MLQQRQRAQSIPQGSLAQRIVLGVLVAIFILAAAGSAHATCPSCGTNPCTLAGSYTIASGDVCNYSGTDVILTGTFNGDNNADCYTVQAASLTVRGTLRARSSCINVEVTGNFKTETVSNSASTVDVRDADSSGDGVSITCGSATINGKSINANADGSGTPGYFTAGDILIDSTGAVSGTGGPITANGGGGDDGGTITVYSSGSTINLSNQMTANGDGSFSFGGAIAYDGAGDVTLGSATNSIEAHSAGGGYAGTVEVVSTGAVTINGAINVDGNGEDTDGGTITVSGTSLTTGTSWQARGDNGGDGGTIEVDVSSGAGTVTTTSGTASWNVYGASFPDDGGSGGAITIYGLGAVTLAGDMDAGGNGDSASGGSIDISTEGNITIQSTSRLEADSAGTDASDGWTSFVGCNITVAGDVDTRNTNLQWGTNGFDSAGVFTQNSGSSILADDDGGNDVYCRCVDTTPADGTCDGTTPTCVTAPTFGGTVTPAANVHPAPRQSCG